MVRELQQAERHCIFLRFVVKYERKDARASLGLGNDGNEGAILMVYHAAIIGTGPAGLSAALNLKIHGKSLIWFGDPKFSEKLRKAERISNYPGFCPLSGTELAEAFQRQANQAGLEIKSAMVTSVMPFGSHYALMAGEEFFEAEAVILATGITVVGAIPGEKDFLGRGVSYCATCDGNLYRGKTLAVLSNTPRFSHELQFLAGLAGKVYYFPLHKQQERLAENVERMEGRMTEIRGEKRVEAVRLKDGQEIAVDGVFCLRDSISLATLLPGLETRDGHIAVDRRMATNLPGCFAAGDCTGRPYQYAKAAGEGNVAAHSLLEYLSEKLL